MKPSRYSDRGTNSTDFLASNPESYLDDGRLFDLVYRKNESDDRNSSRGIVNEGRSNGCGRLIDREIESDPMSDAKVSLGVTRGTYDHDRACKNPKQQTNKQL